MWAVIKIDKKKLCFLKEELRRNFGEGSIIYSPKLLIEKFKKNKLHKREHNILGDYLFCYHAKFTDAPLLKQLNFLRGVKYFLEGFQVSQNEIKTFIKRCKNLENRSGYISQSLFQEQINKHYKFSSGPFTDKIFKIIRLQKNKLDILMGNLKTTVEKRKYLFSPV